MQEVQIWLVFVGGDVRLIKIKEELTTTSGTVISRIRWIYERESNLYI